MSVRQVAHPGINLPTVCQDAGTRRVLRSGRDRETLDAGCRQLGNAPERPDGRRRDLRSGDAVTGDPAANGGGDGAPEGFDHHDSRFVVDPAGVIGPLREAHPLVHSDLYGGFWMLTRYEDVT